jgi:hypothetical protein
MTIAFDLAALKELARPDAVFNDARQWSEYVGVISEKPTYVVTNFTRKHRIRQDFFSGPRGREESLANVMEQFGTDRHVYVGVGGEAEARAPEAGGAFIDLKSAAAAAGGGLGEPEPAVDRPEGTRDDWP